MGLVAAVAMVTALVLSSSRAGHLALFAGVVVMLATASRQIRRCKILLAVFSLITVVIVVLWGGGSTEKWAAIFSGDDVGTQVRWWIWRASIAMALEHPVGGVGLGNFAYWAPQYMGGAAVAYHNAAATYHAHFDLLELVCETGALGLLFPGWLLSRYRIRCNYAFFGAVVLAIFSCLYPTWASVPHALAALLLVGMNLGGRSENSVRVQSRLSGRAIWSFVGGMILICALLHTAVALRPSFLLRRAEDAHLAGEDAESAYRAATTGLGFRGEAHESFGIYLLERGNRAGALQEFFSARKELDTGRLYKLLSTTSAALGYHDLARDFEKEELLRWPWVEKNIDYP
ncbi:MAG: O-antigen ligase family protein [Candidatus Hydrogenedentes bacterium]|nr:O-antigen ligase family protein [Candidatus Hydrogenedentota bacterium]